MAMSNTRLGDKIAARLTASNASDEAKAQVKALWEGVAQDIIDEVKQADGLVAAGIKCTTPSGPGATSETGSVTITG
jgi:hypothetical protein